MATDYSLTTTAKFAGVPTRTVELARLSGVRLDAKAAGPRKPVRYSTADLFRLALFHRLADSFVDPAAIVNRIIAKAGASFSDQGIVAFVGPVIVIVSAGSVKVMGTEPEPATPEPILHPITPKKATWAAVIDLSDVLDRVRGA